MLVRFALCGMFFLVCAAAATVLAGEGGCGCGGSTCQLVKKTKKVKVVCYGAKCKDICIPKPGSSCKTTAGVGKGKCECGGTCKGACKVTYASGEPGCPKIRTINQLVKYEVTKEVPYYEWVIVKGCSCNGGGEEKGHQQKPASINDDPIVPPAPVPASSASRTEAPRVTLRIEG